MIRLALKEAAYRLFLLFYAIFWNTAWAVAIPYVLIEPSLRIADHVEEFRAANSKASWLDFVRTLFSRKLEHQSL